MLSRLERIAADLTNTLGQSDCDSIRGQCDDETEAAGHDIRALDCEQHCVRSVAATDRAEFGRTLGSVNPVFELEAMTAQIHILSGNVRRKHRATNLGFIFAAITLVFFLGAA